MSIPKKIWSSPQLPSLPVVAVKILELSKNPEAEISAFIEAINSDPAIAAKILKSTNSAYFGLSRQVNSVERAVPLLGKNVVTSLALSFSLADDAVSKGPIADHFRSYWRQSVLHAVTARLLGEREDKSKKSEYFLAGLLLDLGRLAMLKTIKKEYLPVLDQAIEQQTGLLELESRELGFNHVEVGQKLMEHWKLPQPIVEAAQHHHASVDNIVALKSSPNYTLIAAVATAAAMGEYYESANKGPEYNRLKGLTTEIYDMDARQLEEFVKSVAAGVAESGDLFSVDTAELSDPADLMAEANEHIAQLTLRQQVTTTELQNQNRELQARAQRDPLTRLFNRAYFDDRILAAFKRARQSTQPLAVIFTDIDRFKSLNDTYGHQFGDIVLQQVSKIIGEVLRPGDVLARFGGEEFVILVANPTVKAIERVAERIRARIEAEVFTFEDKNVPTTISVGAAILVPSRNDDAEGIIKKLVAEADAAMYDSKQNGRNQVHTRSLLDESYAKISSLASSRKWSRWLVAHQHLDVRTVSAVLVDHRPGTTRKIGELAVEKKLLSNEQVESILAEQSSSGARFGEIAIHQGLLSEVQVADLLALQSENPDELARAIVADRLLESQTASELLDKYRASLSSEAGQITSGAELVSSD